MNILKTSIGIALATVITTAQATTLDQARSIENKSNTASAVSQAKIDKSSEATLAYKAEIEQLQEEVKNLAVYRDHLTGLVNSQQQEMTSLDDQIDTIKETRQGVVPLMYKMLSGLNTAVEQDKPIKTEERLQRIAKLEHMMTRADVSERAISVSLPLPFCICLKLLRMPNGDAVCCGTGNSSRAGQYG